MLPRLAPPPLHPHHPPAMQVVMLQSQMQSSVFWQEAGLLRLCIHPRIVPLYGVGINVRAPQLHSWAPASVAASGCALCYRQKSHLFYSARGAGAPADACDGADARRHAEGRPA